MKKIDRHRFKKVIIPIIILILLFMGSTFLDFKIYTSEISFEKAYYILDGVKGIGNKLATEGTNALIESNAYVEKNYVVYKNMTDKGIIVIIVYLLLSNIFFQGDTTKEEIRAYQNLQLDKDIEYEKRFVSVIKNLDKDEKNKLK